MKNPRNASHKATLRRRARELVATRPPTQDANAADPAHLLRELEIHRIELQMQNEQLRAAHAEMEQQLDRYTLLFDFAPIGYAALGSDSTVLDVNHVGAMLLGAQRVELIGRRFQLFVAEEHRMEFHGLLEDVLSSDVKRTSEIELDAMGASERLTVRLTADSLSASNKSVLLAFEDITAQKRAEINLWRAHKELLDTDRRKDEFLAILSHELRTPLSTVLIRAELLELGKVDSSDVGRAGGIITRAALSQARLIDDLLDVSHIAAGKLSFQHDRVDLAPVLKEAVDSVAADAHRKEIDVHLETGRVSEVTGDRARLQQAVVNLLGNAIKFTPPKGRVSLTLREIDRRASIEVRDSGSGIERDFLPYLFERFAQADRTTTRMTGGLGLGLSIAKAIVEGHHGCIHAESPGAGKGSTFIIDLPLALRPSDAPKASAGSAIPDARIRGANLLVVEDDPGTRATLTEALLLAGADVRGAEGGAAAMKVLDDFAPDLLVCDFAMPEEDGCSLLRRIRARYRSGGRAMPALALTAFATEKDRERVRGAGFDEHLAKPVDVEHLLAAVSRLLPS